MTIKQLLQESDELIEEVNQFIQEYQGQGGPRERQGGTDYCICPACKTRIKHQRGGAPCNSRSCPKCGTMMTGENAPYNKKR